MAGTQYLLDSNILLRWVKPDHNDYPLVVSAADAIVRHDDVLCYTLQNVGSSGTRVPALSTATATLFPLKKQTGEPNSSSRSCDCSPTAWRCTRSGEDC